MKKIILFLISLILFSISSYSQNCNNKLKVGSSWEVTTYNKKNKKTGKSISKITDIEESNGETVYIIENQSFDKRDKPNKDGKTTIKSVCKNGKYYMDPSNLAKSVNSAFDKNKETKDVTVDVEMKPIEVPKGNTPAGTILENASIKITTTFDSSFIPPMVMSFNLIDREVVNSEEVETPAGKFTCQKVDYQLMIKNALMSYKSKAIDWYYDGFLIARSEVYNKKGKLQSYNVLTALNY